MTGRVASRWGDVTARAGVEAASPLIEPSIKTIRGGCSLHCPCGIQDSARPRALRSRSGTFVHSTADNPESPSGILARRVRTTRPNLSDVFLADLGPATLDLEVRRSEPPDGFRGTCPPASPSAHRKVTPRAYGDSIVARTSSIPSTLQPCGARSHGPSPINRALP